MRILGIKEFSSYLIRNSRFERRGAKRQVHKLEIMNQNLNVFGQPPSDEKLKFAEYQSLREEMLENRKFIFERPFLIIGGVAWQL